MTEPRTLTELLTRGADEAPALDAPGRRALSYRALRGHLEAIVAALAQAGVGRADRIAIVLPNGPELALAVLAAAQAGAAAPLNPAYTREEFDFYLRDLSARALIVSAGEDNPAITAARAAGTTIVRLKARANEPAGIFSLSAEGGGRAHETRAPQPEDPALYLHTSGTTARPKLVPLSQKNLAASARAIASTLALGPDDACLNVMPLFHIHGTAAALLASLSAGGRVVCTPGFNALKFFAWLEEKRPTWYTAVPTMHQAILARTARNRAIIARCPLRFVRSSSAPLPQATLKELEAAFGAPVIEAYGMTEAAHQMASNPLPPGLRKPGSVGPGAGCEIAVMDETGRRLGPGQTGEVTVRGEGVMAGYDHDPEANAEAFVDGWFRTGDLGTLDREGYLTLSGRLKEIINRGGEKIAPREIDEALSAHPAVAQAVAFAVPHPALGQDVAAAVVLKEGAKASPEELRAYLAQRLAPFKVPRKLLVLEAIPTGPTGKLVRSRLAELLAEPLGLAS